MRRTIGSLKVLTVSVMAFSLMVVLLALRSAICMRVKLLSLTCLRHRPSVQTDFRHGAYPYTERKGHELTHLPFRSWCPACVKAKSKRNHSRALKTKQPIIQLDYCYFGR